jgi:hypothetical protein
VTGEPTPEIEFFETDEAEATAPETAAIVAPEAKSEIPEAKSEVAESAQAQVETAAVEIVEPVANSEKASTETEGAIAGPSEAERAAFAQAVAEMAVAAALEARTTSVVAAEAPAESTLAASIEAETVAAPATPPAETFDPADDDLSDLFEPEPDAALDPNNILLGPAPVSPPAPAFTLDPATAAVLPMHDMALPEAHKAASPQLKLVEMVKPEAAKTPVPAKPHDPLAPLKAMSDEEKIALFS